MIHLRLAVPAVLVAAIVAGCFTYFIIPPPPVEADQRLPLTVPNMTGRPDSPTNIDQSRSAEDHAVAAFQRAAEAILKRAPNAQASAGTGQAPIAGISRCQKGARSRARDSGNAGGGCAHCRDKGQI
jgi:hypothetical protein